MKRLTKLIGTAGLSLSCIFLNPVYSQTTKKESGNYDTKFGTYNTKETYIDLQGKERIRYYNKGERGGAYRATYGDEGNADFRVKDKTTPKKVVDNNKGSVDLVSPDTYESNKNSDLGKTILYTGAALGTLWLINKLSKPRQKKYVAKESPKTDNFSNNYVEKNTNSNYENSDEPFWEESEEKEEPFWEDKEKIKSLLESRIKEAEEYFDNFERNVEWCNSQNHFNDKARESCITNVNREYPKAYEKVVEIGAYYMMKEKLGEAGMESVKLLEELYTGKKEISYGQFNKEAENWWAFQSKKAESIYGPSTNELERTRKTAAYVMEKNIINLSTGQSKEVTEKIMETRKKLKDLIKEKVINRWNE